MTTQRPFDPRELLELSVRCPYCGDLSELILGSQLFPHIDNCRYDYFYRCRPCRAFIGCIPGTKTPKGRLANPELRKAKKAARQAFNAIAYNKELQGASRYMAYKSSYDWLSNRLGLPREFCNFDLMTLEQCWKAAEVCNNLRWYGME